MVEIRCYPAKNGDAFLVKATESPFAMLIDGGYADTFRRYIKSDLEKLAVDGYTLDVVVATHIDADHISGLLSFFDQNFSAKAPAIISVGIVFHNSLLGLVTPTERRIIRRSDDDLALLTEIRMRGYSLPYAPENREQEISARQGSALAQLLQDGGYHWNISSGTVSIGGEGLVELQLSEAKIQVLGPNKARLDTLKNWWISEIRRLGLVGSVGDLDDIFEFLCSYEVVANKEELLSLWDDNLEVTYFPDNSITNGSSISLIIEIENKRLLFLGDSCAEDIVAALTVKGSETFDAIKIAHHGSARNTSTDLLNLIDSPHFFVSTNGDGHNHPDYAVLKAIVDRPCTFCRTLHFNYSTEASRKLKKYQSEAKVNFLVDDEQTDWITINDINAI